MFAAFQRYFSLNFASGHSSLLTNETKADDFQLLMIWLSIYFAICPAAGFLFPNC